MNKQYRCSQTTVSMIRYHFVFCPRYRRKIFLIPGVEERFKELVRQICQEKELDILAMECDKDHVHLFVEAWPQQSIPSIMKWIKGPTSHIIRNEFPQLPASRAYGPEAISSARPARSARRPSSGMWKHKKHGMSKSRITGD